MIIMQSHIAYKCSKFTYTLPSCDEGNWYKRLYGDVPSTWVAKAASWYMNGPLYNTEFGICMGQFFQIFQISNLTHNWNMKGSLFLEKLVSVGPKGLLSNFVMAHPYQNQKVL